MIIYEDEYTVVDMDLSVRPIIFTFSIHGAIYHYGIGGVTEEKCPYDKDVKAWMKKVRLKLNEYISADNQPGMDPRTIAKIDTPFKPKLRIKL